MRSCEIKRKTGETDIELFLDLDGNGKSDIETGCGFLNHMLELFSRHGRFDLNIKCMGDAEVDFHHTAEDVGICLGIAFSKCLENKNGITRYGDTILPMDESLIMSAVDISGRSGCYYELSIPSQKVGDFDTELCEEFWRAFSGKAGLTLHIRQLCGSNSHHIIEGAFKSTARSLKKAVKIDKDFQNEIPSTKGIL